MYFLSQKHFICSEKPFTHFFVVETIYAPRPESFCTLNFAIRKVQTFWVSAVFDRLPCQLKKITAFV